MKIVFFGDSVTDADRDRANPDDLGKGFVLFAANKLRLLYPEKEFKIVNRGIGGDRTANLLERVPCSLRFSVALTSVLRT